MLGGPDRTPRSRNVSRVRFGAGDLPDADSDRDGFRIVRASNASVDSGSSVKRINSTRYTPAPTPAALPMLRGPLHGLRESLGHDREMELPIAQRRSYSLLELAAVLLAPGVTPGRFGGSLQRVRTVCWRVGRAVLAVEVAKGHRLLELIERHAPEVGAVVDRLGECTRKSGFCGPVFNSAIENLTFGPGPDQIRGSGRQRRLPTHDHHRAGPAELLDGNHLRVLREVPLQLLLVVRQPSVSTRSAPSGNTTTILRAIAPSPPLRSGLCLAPRHRAAGAWLLREATVTPQR